MAKNKSIHNTKEVVGHIKGVMAPKIGMPHLMPTPDRPITLALQFMYARPTPDKPQKSHCQKAATIYVRTRSVLCDTCGAPDWSGV